MTRESYESQGGKYAPNMFGGTGTVKRKRRYVRRSQS